MGNARPFSLTGKTKFDLCHHCVCSAFPVRVSRSSSGRTILSGLCLTTDVSSGVIRRTCMRRPLLVFRHQSDREGIRKRKEDQVLFGGSLLV